MISRTRRVLHNVAAAAVLVAAAMTVFAYGGPDWLAFSLAVFAALFSTRGAEIARMSRDEYITYAHTGLRSTDRPRHPF